MCGRENPSRSQEQEIWAWWIRALAEIHRPSVFIKTNEAETLKRPLSERAQGKKLFTLARYPKTNQSVQGGGGGWGWGSIIVSGVV